jgi:hypothetical protein
MPEKVPLFEVSKDSKRSFDRRKFEGAFIVTPPVSVSPEDLSVRRKPRI